MLNNLGDIYNYLSQNLLQRSVKSIDSVIDYLEEAQQKIAQKWPVQAPVFTTTLTTNSFTLPTDFDKLVKATVKGVEVNPEMIWQGEMTLPSAYNEGELKLWYYKKITPLNKANLAQVPEIDQRFFPAMAKYAAGMFYVVDDDPEQQRAFDEAFMKELTGMAEVGKPKVYQLNNLW